MRQEKSIVIRTIINKNDPSKIIYHSVFLTNIIPEGEWGPSPSSTRRMPSSPISYSYHDYITTWSRFMLHQNENMSHSYFVNFDKHFTTYLPLWFNRWWTQFGPIAEIFLEPLLNAFKCFSRAFKVDSHGAKFPALLHFVKHHKITWILKWKYEKEGDVLAHHWYVKWWDKFPHTQSIVATITKEFSPYADSLAAKDYSPAQSPVQIDAPTTSSINDVKSKKKSSPLDNFRKILDALFAFLKLAEEAIANHDSEGEGSNEGSKASVADNPYYPYD